MPPKANFKFINFCDIPKHCNSSFLTFRRVAPNMAIFISGIIFAESPIYRMSFS